MDIEVYKLPSGSYMLVGEDVPDQYREIIYLEEGDACLMVEFIKNDGVINGS